MYSVFHAHAHNVELSLQYLLDIMFYLHQIFSCSVFCPVSLKAVDLCHFLNFISSAAVIFQQSVLSIYNHIV